MKRKTILFQLFAFQLVLLVMALGVITGLFIQSTRSFYYRERRADLEAVTLFVHNILAVQGFPSTTREARFFSDHLARNTEIRITLILPDGTVVADSVEDPAVMGNHAGRPEVLAALRGRSGYSLRYSATVNRTMMYTARAVKNNDEILGVVRASFPGDTIKDRMASLYFRAALAGFVILGAAVGVSWVTARRLSETIRNLKGAAIHYAREDFNYPLTREGPEELRDTAEALRTMGGQLRTRLATIRDQKRELQTILDNMDEPVVFTDRQIHIIKLNSAAEKLFHHPDGESRGRNLLEIFRNSEMHSFAERILSEAREGDKEITIEETGGRTFEVHGTPLTEGEQGGGGLLLVFHDISQRKKLEILRKEFVASVSHELKTPVTNIKGYVETLLSAGSLDGPQSRTFLEIIAKHTNRLSAIIDDLLTLSEIEKTGKTEIVKEPVLARDLLSSVQLVCSPRADLKGITLKVECPLELTLTVHPLLAEQAVLNLVDNAIKYSGEGTEVVITALPHEKTGGVVVTVEDQGPGIPEADLERIFERFYTVDKARSRQVGGTGLGLSIVKHIALVHGGNVSVRSKVGRGSFFRIDFSG